MMYRGFKAALAATFLVFMLANSAAADPSLSGHDIKKLFPGSYHAQAGGHTLTISGHSNGALEGKAILGFMRDTGRWWVSANKLCVAFSDWLGGKPRCGQIRKIGGWYTALLGGGDSLRFRAL